MTDALKEIMDRAREDASFRRLLLSDMAAATVEYNLTREQLGELQAMIGDLDGGKPDPKKSRFRLF